MLYKDYLKSDHWIRIKAKLYHYGSEKKSQCKLCGSKKFLNIHHLTYERLGKELPKDLIILCQSCHYKVHDGRIPKNTLDFFFKKHPRKKELLQRQKRMESIASKKK